MGGGKYVCHVFAEYKVSTASDTDYLELACNQTTQSQLCCVCFAEVGFAYQLVLTLGSYHSLWFLPIALALILI